MSIDFEAYVTSHGNTGLDYDAWPESSVRGAQIGDNMIDYQMIAILLQKQLNVWGVVISPTPNLMCDACFALYCNILVDNDAWLELRVKVVQHD